MLRAIFNPTLLASLLSAALTAAALPPLSWWPLALLAPAPLFWRALRPFHFWRDGRWCLLGTLPLWAWLQWWVLHVSFPGYFPFVLLQSFWTVLAVWMLAKLLHCLARVPFAIVAAMCWTSVEYIRGEVFMDGYAWNLTAYPLIDSPVIRATPALAAPAAWLGVYAVSFLAACFGASAAQTLATRRRAPAIGGLVLLAAWSASPLLMPAPAEAPGVRIALVQTNVPQDNKIGWTIEQEFEDWKRFEALTVQASKQSPRPDLIVWPETMMPGITLEPDAIETLAEEGIYHNLHSIDGPSTLGATAFSDRLLEMHRRLEIPLLVGEEGVDGLTVRKEPGGGIRLDRAARFNSAYLVAEGRVQPDRYDKIRLTPFGEVMPYISAWPWLEKQFLDFGARGMSFDLSAGTEATVFALPIERGERTVRFVTPICFESTITNHIRRMVYDGGTRRADLIVCITNDGWFGDSDTNRECHLQAARWRSLELGTPTARGANTGICAFIDSRGNLTASGVEGSPGATRSDGVLAATVPLNANTTLYARIGPWMPRMVCGVTILLLVASYLRTTHQARVQPAAGKASKGTTA